MSLRTALGTVALATLASAGTIATYHATLARPAPAVATLDIGEIYRLKESQIATLLVKREASDAERLAHLKQAADFATDTSWIFV